MQTEDAGNCHEAILIRGAKREEQRALTRLIVRATLHSGYDEVFIDRARPALPTC